MQREGGRQFCPDLALVPAAEKNRNLTPCAPDPIEVVSPSSVRNEYEVKNKQYTARGIPNQENRIGRLTVDTDRLPVDPKTSAPS